MNFANPYLFDAILDGIPHRFVLVQECEYLQGHDGFSPPRFSVGAVNATRDPRYSAIRQLMEVGVSDSALQIPQSWLMAHQYIYILHEYTDEFGWQYRSQWSALGPPGPKDEPWMPSPNANSRVRRRIWLTTIVPKYELVRAKRLLAENLKIDYGNVKLQGELYRYEKGTLNRSWNKRRFILYHNRIEIYTSSTKKTEVMLADCEVKMLPDGQIAGAKNVFVVRNLSGTVNLLLSAEDQRTRQEWIFAIQYQLAMNSPDVNFIPLEYSPPTSDYPDNRVLVAGDLKLQSPDGQMIDRSFHLLPREVVYYDGEDLRGRIFVEKATVAAEERNLNFSLTSATGITLNLAADSPEQKNMWMLSVRKQVQYIDAYNTMKRNLPREEQEDPNQPAVDRISQFYDGNWSAPPVAGEDEEYIRRIFTAPYENHPDHFEFSEELGIRFDKKAKPEASTFKVEVQTRAHTTELIKPTLNRYKSMQIITEDLADIKELNIPSVRDKAAEIQKPELKKINELVIPERKEIAKLPEEKKEISPSSSGGMSPAISVTSPTMTPTLPQTTRSLARLKSTMSMLNMSGAVKYLNVKRVLINPRFMLAALKGITHRFVLVLESENRINAPRDIQDMAPLRFTVGGSRASKDPRMVKFDQLIGISNKNPEVQLPPGWFMLHQYINIIQSNTDDYGWQYRSTWSEGTLNATDEQWVDICDETKQVRRRLWMTTVVKRDDFIKAKKLVTDDLSKSPDDFILKEDLYLYDADKGSSATSWQRRNVILYHNKVEFYSGNEKVNDVSLVDCEVKVLTGADAAGRSFPFSIYHPNGSVNVKLDATDKDMRLRWIRALLYQLAIITPDVNFSPFVFGPPTGELAETRILLCGELEVLDNATNNWDLQTIQLQEQALLVMERDGHLHGRLLLDHAVVKARDDECEFTVRAADGLVVHFRAMNPDTKFSWVRILKRQINLVEFLGDRKAAEEGHNRTVAKNYQDQDWISREGEYGEDDAYMRSIRQTFKSNLVSTWSGERGSETPTASSLVTEQWRITQQNAAMKLNATSASSDITQTGRYGDSHPYADSSTEIGSHSTEPIVRTMVTKVVRTTTTTTNTINTTNVVSDDGQGNKTIITGTKSSSDVVEAMQKQGQDGKIESVVRTTHSESASGAPVDVRNLPLPPNLLSKFGKTKSPTNSSVRITELPSDDSPVSNSPLRNKSLRLTNEAAPATAGDEHVGDNKMTMNDTNSNHSAVASAQVSSVPTSIKLEATPQFPATSLKSSAQTSATSSVANTATTSTTTKMVSKLTADEVPDSIDDVDDDVDEAPTTKPRGVSFAAETEPSASSATETQSSTSYAFQRPANSGKTIIPQEVNKTPEFMTVSLRGVVNPATGSAPSVDENVSGDASKKNVTLISPKMSVASMRSNQTSEFDDLDDLLNVRKEDIEYHDDDDEDGGVRRSPVDMHTTSQYFTEEEEDKGEDYEEAAKAVQQIADSVDDETHDNAQKKLRTLNQMTIGYMRRLNYVEGTDPTHAYIPMSHLNDYDQAYVLENGFFKEGEESATHAYIPLEALRRSLMSLEAERNKAHADIKKVTLRHVPTNLLIRRGIDKPSGEPESELLREARRRATSRRLHEDDDGTNNNAQNEGEEPEFLREARRRQQSRRVSLPEENMEFGSSNNNNKSEEPEPEFLREAKRRQASRRLSIENDGTTTRDNEVENEAVREAKRREQRRREMEEEAQRKNQTLDADQRRLQEEDARRRWEQEEQARRAEKIAALEEEKNRKLTTITVDVDMTSSNYSNNNTNSYPSAPPMTPTTAGDNSSRMSFSSPNYYNNNNTNTNASEDVTNTPQGGDFFSSPTTKARLPPSGGQGRRFSTPMLDSRQSSFDLEEELSQVSKRLRPVPASDDMSVGSHRDDMSISSQQRRAVRLKNMSTEYLQRKGYLLPGNDFATIPLGNLRSSDQKLVTENGFLNEEGTHAIIPLKNNNNNNNNNNANNNETDSSGKMMEQVNLKPVARDGLPPPRPGLVREDSSILKSVTLRPVERRDSGRKEEQQPMVSPLVQVKQKLRRVSAASAGTDSGAEDGNNNNNWTLNSNSRDDDDAGSVSSPFKGVKLRPIGNNGPTSLGEEGSGVPATPRESAAAAGLGVGLGVAGAAAVDDVDNDGDNDDEDNQVSKNNNSNSNSTNTSPRLGNLRAKNVRSNSIMGKIQKFEKPATLTLGGSSSSNNDNATNSMTSPTGSEIRGISRSTSIAAKRTETATSGTSSSVAQSPMSSSNKPPNPLLQKKKTLGEAKKSFRF